MGKRNRSHITQIALAVGLIGGLVIFPQGARAQAAVGGLSCRNGLAVHLYTPQSRESTPLRMRNGLQVGASERLLTITGSFVREARIREYRERLGLKIGESGPQMERSFFSVTLQLNGRGAEELDRAIARGLGAELVVVCDDTALRGQIVREDSIRGIDVLIDDLPAESAKEFARSFTASVRWERHTPTPER